MRRAAEQHVRPHGLLPLFHVLIGVFPKPFRIDALLRKSLHLSISDVSKRIHLFCIVYQGIFHLLLISTIRRVGKLTYHIMDQFFGNTALLIPAAGAAVCHDRIHDFRRCVRIRRGRADFRSVSENTYRALRTDRQTMLTSPAPVPSEFFKRFHMGTFVFSHKKYAAGAHLRAFPAADALVADHKFGLIHTVTLLSF